MRHERPLLQLVDQLFPRGAGVDVAAAVAQGLGSAGLEGSVRPGARIAITAGSRGIADLPAVLRAAVAAARGAEALRSAGPLFPLPYDENGDLRSPFS